MNKLISTRLNTVKNEEKRQKRRRISLLKKQHIHYTQKYRKNLKVEKKPIVKVVKEKIQTIVKKQSKSLMKISIPKAQIPDKKKIKFQIFQTDILDEAVKQKIGEILEEKQKKLGKVVVENPTRIDKETLRKALLHLHINKHFSSRIHPSVKHQEKRLEQFHSHEPQKFINKQLFSISK